MRATPSPAVSSRRSTGRERTTVVDPRRAAMLSDYVANISCGSDGAKGTETFGKPSAIRYCLWVGGARSRPDHVGFFPNVFHRAQPDLQRMKLLLAWCLC